ncbi:ATP-dependent DNA helicase DDX11-like [Dendronephthya gigantea]|uniref:ATP-dependent DNA helicase DDX11-like n=1 Tax=Dendronephthya gigantea TaxID=151771 RepID=UPI0010693729|nr:ATP-dependent DNA helicase DDX11-like [Dendronephthya gigantea]
MASAYEEKLNLPTLTRANEANKKGNVYEQPGYFEFPFTPYDIQIKFMQNLYSILHIGGVGIFESPTGTGKSLSLICGALTWLRDFNQNSKRETVTTGTVDDIICASDIATQGTSESIKSSVPSWVSEVATNRERKMLLEQAKAEQEKEERYSERLKLLKQQRHWKRQKRKHETQENRDDDEIEQRLTAELNELDKNNEDSDIVLDEYHSDNECGKVDASSDEEELDEPYVTKIYYCSRTHSQLDQFVKEVKKSSFGSNTRVVSLGSRLNLCINDDVKKLRSINRVNERCLELQKRKKEKKKEESQSNKKLKSKNGCPYYDHQRLQNYKDLILMEVKDVEELISVGEEIEGCPYYGTRYAIPKAELVVLPYNMLLHQAAREACGIRLKGNVVIIDEAHNLIETISNIHSVEISGIQISRAHSQLLQYRDRYGSRLKAKNLMYVKQILQVLSCLLSCFDVSSPSQGHHQGDCKADVRLLKINDFLFTTKMDNINLFKIKRYCERSMISKKLNGFVDKYNTTLLAVQDGSEDGEFVSTSSPLQVIENFLECLTNADKDGRIFINNQAVLSRCSLKFLLLNPAVYFKSVVQEARAVIVAGGTMQPVSEFKQQLLYSCSVSTQDIHEFSCGHIIPEENLLAVTLAKGPSAVELDFTYQSRECKAMISEIGRVLSNICKVVPAGLVCFFPSYDYKEKVVKEWHQSGAFQTIDAKKKIFSEPKKAAQVEQTLCDYGKFIKKTQSSEGKTSHNGAMLLCVVGGKMSEGINFSDDLGRCIVVVGLPYPNIQSPELKEYISYLDATLGHKAGQQHCENVCMKAVNQSIGRAIRHINDYATIILLDQRYGRSSVQTKLPEWIRSRLQTHTSFGPAFGALRKFFLKRFSRVREEEM